MDREEVSDWKNSLLLTSASIHQLNRKLPRGYAFRPQHVETHPEPEVIPGKRRRKPLQPSTAAKKVSRLSNVFPNSKHRHVLTLHDQELLNLQENAGIPSQHLLQHTFHQLLSLLQYLLLHPWRFWEPRLRSKRSVPWNFSLKPWKLKLPNCKRKEIKFQSPRNGFASERRLWSMRTMTLMLMSPVVLGPRLLNQREVRTSVLPLLTCLFRTESPPTSQWACWSGIRCFFLS